MNMRNLLVGAILLAGAFALPGCSHRLVAHNGETSVAVYANKEDFDKVSSMKSQGGPTGLIGGMGQTLMSKKFPVTPKSRFWPVTTRVLILRSSKGPTKGFAVTLPRTTSTEPGRAARIDRAENLEGDSPGLLQGVRAALASPDSHHFLHRHDENFAVADAPGTRRALDGLDYLSGGFVGDDYLELDLGQEIDHVFGPAIEFSVSLLPTESFDLADRQALDTDTRQSFFHLVELERFDDRLNLLHMTPLGGLR